MTIADIAPPADVPVEDVADRLEAIEALLCRLVADVDELKLELRRARSERLEDMTLVVDLLSTSWRAVDRRLGHIDRQLDRLERSSARGGRPRLP